MGVRKIICQIDVVFESDNYFYLTLLRVALSLSKVTCNGCFEKKCAYFSNLKVNQLLTF